MVPSDEPDARRALGPVADEGALRRVLEPHEAAFDDPSVRRNLLHSLAASFWDRPIAERRELLPGVAALSALDLADAIDDIASLRALVQGLYARVLVQFPGHVAAHPPARGDWR